MDLGGSDLVVISDVHLRKADDERSLLLLSLLKDLARQPPRKLVLLGDVFDFCFGGSFYFRKKFKAFSAALKEVREAGSEVLFFEGNHEFGMPSLGWDGVKFLDTQNYTIPLSKDRKLLVAHGDLLNAPSAYKVFRALVKSWLAKFLARFVPGIFLDMYALKHASVSRASDQYRTIDHDALKKSCLEWLRKNDAQTAIIGHFHVPYNESLASSGERLLSVHSWDKPNFLSLKDGKILRGYYDAAQKRWIMNVAKETYF